MKNADQQSTRTQSTRTPSDSAGDGLRHIICFLCYPSFESQPAAPHDAECICGKPVKRGDLPIRNAAPDCILCDEMAEGHYRRLHRDEQT